MSDIVLITYDWVPPPPRGFVRDIRARWALEEAGLPYTVKGTPFQERGPDHIAHQPFGQTPWLTDGDLSVFESGAILLHLGAKSDILMPTEPQARADAKNWLFAALNSVEAVSLPWWFVMVYGHKDTTAWTALDDFLKLRLQRLEPVFADNEWLAGPFSIADIMMADVLRLVDKHDGLDGYPACQAYLARAVARPAFQKAHADQMAYFAAAD